MNTYPYVTKEIAAMLQRIPTNDPSKPPMYYEVVDWLIDTHKIQVLVARVFEGDKPWGWFIDTEEEEDESIECFDTHYSALQRGVEEALKLI